MSNERSSLTNEQINEVASLTDGYSGADMKNLCQEASLGPIRSISFSAMHQISADQVHIFFYFVYYSVSFVQSF